jgi:flavin-dependent thymidylate synthase
MPELAFASAAPVVKLVGAFAQPFDNAVATARTCYSSKGIITPEQVAKNPEARDRLARSIYDAGHHTTLQHAHFQFALENVSRHFIWSFLHSHPFYNSEQVSQRYVEVKPGAYAVPPLSDAQRAVYEACALSQIQAYQRLIEVLTPPTAREYYRIFPARQKKPESQKEVKKRAQEVARYVLPVATFAFLYHTVSGITLLRYFRLCEQLDAPTETRAIVGAMVDALLANDPSYKAVLEEPLPLEETPEWQHFASRPAPVREADARAFAAEFDRELDGKVSKLVDRKPHNEQAVAQAVREVLGLPRARMSDAEALALALDPGENRYFGETMNLLTLSKLSRALFHASYTFKKKLSHAADSQDQRHRMTPASRPILAAHLGGEPDYVVPELIRHSAAAEDLYRTSMERTWKAIGMLRELGASEEAASYLLPNAVSVRFTESSDLLNLHHKLKSRLCYLAQEEIWRASVDEARQIRELEPTIGRYLLPPCGLRQMTETRPLCPEGERYCGVPVWKLSLSEYARIL